jgi:DNA-binding NarL/FixJ family response regulator
MQRTTGEHNRESIRVLLIVEKQVLLDAMKVVLENAIGIEVVGTTGNPNEFTHSIIDLKPDVVICDLVMQGGDPIALAEIGIARSPKTQILILTSDPTDLQLGYALRAGVAGILTMNETIQNVEQGIRSVFDGQRVYSEEVRTRFKDVAVTSQAQIKMRSLTPREINVVRLVAQGMTTVQIADIIHRSPKTIDNQISSALAKTESANRVELSRWAIREGLINA